MDQLIKKFCGRDLDQRVIFKLSSPYDKVGLYKRGADNAVLQQQYIIIIWGIILEKVYVGLCDLACFLTPTTLFG